MPRNPLVPLVVAALLSLTGTVPAASAAPPAPGTGTKAYAAAVPPESRVVSLSADPVVVVDLTNCGPCEGGAMSAQSFASAEVALPSGLVLGTREPSVDRAQWSISVRTDAVSGARFLRLVSAGRGTTTAIAPGGTLRLSIPVSPTSVPAAFDVETWVKQSNDFSGSGNDFTRVGAAPTVVLEAASAPQVPARLEFVQGPTTVQATTAASSASLTPVLVMCPAPQVRVVDADGAVITSLPPTAVRLSVPARYAEDPGPGLLLDGSADVVRATSGGIATFGSPRGTDGRCATGVTATTVGAGYSLSASGQFGTSTLTTTAATTFDVLPVYALCGQTCSTPSLTSSGTTARVDATGGSDLPDVLTFEVGLDAWEFGVACDPDPGPGGPNPFRAAVTVDLDDHDKSVRLRWSKDAVQWAINNGTPQWRVCLAATYSFQAVGGPAQGFPLGAPAPTWYVGQLLPCGQVTTPGPCLSSLSRQAGEQLATVSIPEVKGDPRMI